MHACLPCRFLVAVVVFLTVCVLPLSRGLAQPKICGNQPALGDWSLANCPTLRDDDGDGIYSLTLSLSDTALLEYKILPTGLWDGSELRAQGTCPADGGGKRNDTQNIQVSAPASGQPASFFFDSRSLGDSSYSPAPANRSGGDSLMLGAPSGACPRWLAVGDFQNLYGANSSAVPLLPLRPGVWAGRTTATKMLAGSWRWKVLEQTSGVAREYGPTGWAYAPCEATFASVSSAVSPGDTIYFLLHAHGGRLQTLVSTTPLDGFSNDGAMTCQPLPDLGGMTLDLAGGGQDAASDPNPVDAGADGGLPRRPGIHCDCQIAAAQPAAAAASETLVAGAAAGLLLLLFRRSHKRLSRRANP